MAESANTFPSISPVSFPQALAAALRVLTAPALAGRAYLQGGFVPWAASGRDSGSPHGDVDVSVRLGDMPVVRAWLAAEDLYDPALDSLSLGCNEGHGDFGAHAVVDGVLVSFCPFYFEGYELRQRNAALVAAAYEAMRIACVAHGEWAGHLKARGGPPRDPPHSHGHPVHHHQREGAGSAREPYGGSQPYPSSMFASAAPP